MRVAIGEINITPDNYIGRPLAGYTPIPTCTGKYDDIYARAVLFEDIILNNVKKRLLLISMDFLQLPLLFTEYVKEKIQEAYKIHPNQILIHATHTHKSFDMSGMFVFGNRKFWNGFAGVLRGICWGAYYGDDKYKVWVAMRVVKLVGQLLKELKPAKIAWTKQVIQEDIVINRRHPSRRSKSALGVITLKDAKSNEIFGIIANFGMHPTTLASFIDKLSADYPGCFVKRISDKTSNKIKSIYFTAPAGDLNPITT
ncbi:MAG: hypothetical protein ACTSRA_07740, partial [Promethearchaeota archaeon]